MKASHKNAQNVTGPTFTPRPLTPEQLNAIPLLCTGMTDAETAAAVGVQRETVWRWRNELPLFISELEKARQQFISGAIDKLRSALPKAVENVVVAINSGDLKASLALLKVVGFDNGTHFQPGETDPATIGLTLCLQQLSKEKIPESSFDLIDIDKNRATSSARPRSLTNSGGEMRSRSITPCHRIPPCDAQPHGRSDPPWTAFLELSEAPTRARGPCRHLVVSSSAKLTDPFL